MRHCPGCKMPLRGPPPKVKKVLRSHDAHKLFCWACSLVVRGVRRFR